MNAEPARARIVVADARNMAEIPDETVHLIITSPPYYHLKDYGVPGQVGYGQSLHEYLIDLSRVWCEGWRVLQPGRRLCINIGDQFARAVVYGRYKVIPLHAEVIAQCESVGFDYMGAIIWEKKTTMHTTGGAVVMGSFPHPPNGIVEIDYEFILLFKKPGPVERRVPEIKQASALTRDEWKEYFTGHWRFGGEKQVLHEAMFPEELPRRLIRMFSFVGETVLDPFLGSGTTAKVAMALGRHAIGYEIQPDFVPIIREKLGLAEPSLLPPPVEITPRQETVAPVQPPADYRPRIQDAYPRQDEKQFRFGRESSYQVTEVVDALTLRLDTGLTVSLLGLSVTEGLQARALEYLRRYLLGKRVRLDFDTGSCPSPGEGSEAQPLPVYLYLTNRLFVNRKMIEMGLATADRRRSHRHQSKFIWAEEQFRGQRVGAQPSV